MKVIFVNDSKRKRKYGDIKLNSGDAVVEVNGIRKWMKKGTFQTEEIGKNEIIIDKVDTVEPVDEPATDEGTKVDEVEPQPEVVEEIVEDEPVDEPVEEKKPTKKSKKKSKK